MYVCPECAHEWATASPTAGAPIASDEAELVVRDANGNMLADGDTVRQSIADLSVAIA